MTGTSIAQAIPIAISPILTRIYTPEDFGVLALYVAIVSICASFVSGKYELAIMIPEDDKEVFDIFILGILIVFFVVFCLLLMVVFLNSYLSNLLGSEKIGFWLYFIPISVFFSGIFNLLSYFNNRLKNYKDIANANIAKSLIAVFIQTLIGYLKQGALGLIIGQILSSMFANFKLLKNIINKKEKLQNIKKTDILVVAKKYQNFPKFLILSGLANTLAFSLLNILISAFYGSYFLGLYSLINRVFYLPQTLIGSSIGQVFFQEASQELKDFKTTHKTYLKVFKRLFIIALPIYIVFFFSAEYIFAFAFGEQWVEAGDYAKILIPLFFINFIISPLSAIFNIAQRQKLDLLFQFFLLIMVIVSIMLSKFYDLSFKDMLMTYAIFLSFAYIINIIISFSISKGINAKV